MNEIMHRAKQIRLGVNVDHVATLRQARGTRYPDPVYAALIAEEAGADLITIHLREDRRHIQERDVRVMQECMQTKMNLEMALTPAMIDFAVKIKPAACCLVPEKREEITTEGGLDVIKHCALLKEAIPKLQAANIAVSLFIDPENDQITAAREVGAGIIELHTGRYCDAENDALEQEEFKRIEAAAIYARKIDLQVHAGHGLHYHNVTPIAAIAEIEELNIGHALIARAVMVGMKAAVREMKRLMVAARY